MERHALYQSEHRCIRRYSAAGQGWLPFGQSVLASLGSVNYTIPNYSTNTACYFRVRVQNAPNNSADGSSAWSNVVQSWTGATYTPDLWYYTDGTFTNGQVVHTLYNFDFAYPSDGSGRPIYGDLQWWDSSNQRWDQVDHILLDSAGGVAYYFDPTAASGQSGVQITSSDQFRIRFDNSAGGSTAWLQLWPNEGTPYDSDQPGQYSASLSTDDEGNHTLTVNWSDDGYTQADIMVISITSNGSEWWGPVNQRVIWEVLGATDSNPNGTVYAFEESATFTNVPDDGDLTVQLQILFTDTGKVSDPLTIQLTSQGRRRPLLPKRGELG